MDHKDLCVIAAKYLKTKGIVSFHRCNYVVCELERQGESPDAFGFSSGTTQLIEVKVSRSDFLSDKNKYWRKRPEYGIGAYRSYLCPIDVIKKSDLPIGWGLLYIDENNKIIEVMPPIKQQSNNSEEFRLMLSLFRREGIKPQIFSYKQYKSTLATV